jgi:hypothetical protein
MSEVSDDEARAALGLVERGRREVIDEIDVPAWYWWALAVGWVAIGVLNDVAGAWPIAIGTLVFGAGHAAVARHVLDGRHRSDRLSVRADVVGRHVPLLVIGSLLLMGALTVGFALLARADGTEHPATAASVVVALLILACGPRLMAYVRRQAARPATRP